MLETSSLLERLKATEDLISILKHIAKILDTSVFYMVGEQDEDIDSDVIKMAMILQQIQNKELRKIAIEQVKVFTFHQ